MSDEHKSSVFRFADNLLILRRARGTATQMLPLRENFWYQYNFKVVSGSMVDSGISKEGSLYFLSLRLSSIAGPHENYPHISAGFEVSDGGRRKLVYNLQPYGKKMPVSISSEYLAKDASYCIETHFDFSTPDTLSFELWVNNRLSGAVKLQYSGPKEFLDLHFHNFRDKEPVALALSEMVILSKRKMVKPSTPLIIGDFEVLPYKSTYYAEELRGVEWRIFRNADTIPVYNEISVNPDKRYILKLPFTLYAGKYSWQARFLNNFGNWGEWSKLCVYNSDVVNEGFFEIESIQFTKVGSSSKIHHLSPGEWYQARLTLDTRGRAWNEFGYIIVWFSGSGHTYGHKGNKGGKFSSRGNYILNFSVDSVRGKPVIRCFEKRTENSFLSEELPQGGKGLYFDANPEMTNIDTISRVITLGFRLLDSAVAGTWRISAYTASTNEYYYGKGSENTSELMTGSIRVENHDGSSKVKFAVPALIVVLLTVIVIAVYSKVARKKTLPAASSVFVRDFERIRTYIEENVGREDLNIAAIRKALFLSRDYAYEVIKANNAGSYPQLINKIRIEKATRLLKDESKNISEVCYDTGFSDPRYFGKVFKEITGVTPSEYRDQLKNG